MSYDLTSAKTADGRPYAGNDRFLGCGVMRSCGRCGTHRSQVGGTTHRLFGWVGPCCAPKAKK